MACIAWDSNRSAGIGICKSLELYCNNLHIFKPKVTEYVTLCTVHISVCRTILKCFLRLKSVADDCAEQQLL